MPDDRDLKLLLEIRLNAKPAVPTSDIVSCVAFTNTNQAVNDRLRPLEEDGYVNRIRVGSGGVWHLTELGKETVEREFSGQFADSGSK